MRTRFQVSSHLAVTKCRIIVDSHSWLFSNFNFKHGCNSTFSFSRICFQQFIFTIFFLLKPKKKTFRTKHFFFTIFTMRRDKSNLNYCSIFFTIFEANQSKKLSFFFKRVTKPLFKSEVWTVVCSWRLWSSCCRAAIPNCLFIHECPLIQESSLTDDDRPTLPIYIYFYVSVKLCRI